MAAPRRTLDRAVEGERPEWDRLREVEMCWQARAERQGGSLLSRLKFMFQRPEGNGAPEAPWNLIFNPLSVYLLSCQGRP